MKISELKELEQNIICEQNKTMEGCSYEFSLGFVTGISTAFLELIKELKRKGKIEEED